MKELQHKPEDKIEIVKQQPDTKSKTKVIQNENCIYLSSLNYKNVVKILERDYSILI